MEPHACLKEAYSTAVRPQCSRSESVEDFSGLFSLYNIHKRVMPTHWGKKKVPGVYYSFSKPGQQRLEKKGMNT